MKTFKVFIARISPDFGVVAATTRGQAMHKAVKSANDAGFNVTFFDARAVRYPEYDHLAEKLGNKVIGSQYVQYLEDESR